MRDGFFTHSLEFTMRLRLFAAIASIGAAMLPDVSFALGGEGIVAGLLTSAGIFVVWIVATIISFSGTRERFDSSWFFAWAVRLSLPIVVLGYIYVYPVFERMKDVRGAQVRSKLAATFEAECKTHAPTATRILHVESAERPKTVYVEEPKELYGPKISQRLVDCTYRRVPACQELDLNAVEWAWQRSIGNGPCKAGADPSRPGACLPDYNRTDFGAERIKVIPIERPASQYIIRVKENSGRTLAPAGIRRYHVTLESLRTAQVLASTELLMSSVAPPCQSFETEVRSVSMTLRHLVS